MGLMNIKDLNDTEYSNLLIDCAIYLVYTNQIPAIYDKEFNIQLLNLIRL